jgi:hypothetical protein
VIIFCFDFVYFFAAHEDVIDGVYMQKAMENFEKRGLLVKPKPIITRDLKISKKKLRKQLGKYFLLSYCKIRHCCRIL